MQKMIWTNAHLGAMHISNKSLAKWTKRVGSGGVNVNVRISVHIRAFMHVCERARLCTRVYACVCINEKEHESDNAYVCTRVYARTFPECVWLCACECACELVNVRASTAPVRARDVTNTDDDNVI